MRLTREEIDEARGTRTVHRNPIERDEVVIVRTSAETGGQYTLLHAYAQPGAQVARHYHRSAAESFEVLEGVLTVENGGKTTVLQPGESDTVPKHTVHRWANQSTKPVSFLVEFTPGQAGFEKSLTIIYGLARDGHTLPNGVPRNVLQLALLMEIGDIWLPRSAALGPVIRALAGMARKKGMERELEERYCR
jgi:quercetin dioxygenase-like cupin family protein